MNRILLKAIILMIVPAGFSAAQAPPDSRAVEQTYLAKAQRNIELYRKQDAVIEVLDAEGRPVNGARVEINQVQQDFLFGCIMFPLTGHDLSAAEREQYQARFLDLFNFGVLPFYWKYYEPSPGKPHWVDMEQTIEWASRNGVTIKGHPLVWSDEAGIPSWLARIPGEFHESLLEARVLSTVSGFAGAVNTLDVVNEPIHLNTWEKTKRPKENHIRRPSVRITWRRRFAGRTLPIPGRRCS